MAGKKSSLLGLQPEIAFTMNEMRRRRRETEIKLLLPAAAVVFKIRSKSETSSAVVHIKHICWFGVVII